MRPPRLLVAATLTALATAALPAAAQPRSPAVLTGKVASDIQAAIEEAEVRVVSSERAARTSPNGVYQVDSIPPGQHMVQVRRLGFTPIYFAVTLKPGERREVDIELKALPTRLSEVRIRERSGYGARDMNRLRDFERRRRGTATSARFLTRDDLATRHRGAGTLFTALRTEWPLSACAAGMGIRGSAAGWRGRGCRVALSIDGGVPMPPETAIDYPLDLVEAVEIYRNGIGMPAEFQFASSRGADVILVVWTGVDTDW